LCSFQADRFSDFGAPELELVGENVRRPSSACSTAILSKKGRSLAQLNNGGVQLPDHEVQQYNISKDCAIKPGDTVELKDKSERISNANHSGDFLRVRQIIVNLETDEIRLRGLRMRRMKYLEQQVIRCKYIASIMVPAC
jgi:hypothetical protein